ncbi:MAG: PhzF family phenazine biosynthesis protein [Candidatus Midichloriaceae bacterium]|jgi:PhzF family phenazine biosynthesis protein|nr:PhzF family phenazine biosynthesis protein [Candidatus Midichloriaceae bacterium]
MITVYTVDAFTNKPFKGNPAGVCIVERFPETELMQNIAMELGYSNTAFVKRKQDDEYDIKWFTVTSEAPLCGHATIGSVHVLFEEGMIHKNKEITFNSVSGTITASVDDSNWYTLNFPNYPVSPVVLTDELREVVNIDPIYTGFAQNCYLMEFESKEALLALEPKLELLKKMDCRALIATSKGVDFDFHSRYFAPIAGIDEDPVCASAHCRLIPYWANKLGKQELRAYQLSRRGGELRCKNLGNRVLISGEAVTVMKGFLNTA